jgi:hypothetical protein
MDPMVSARLGKVLGDLSEKTQVVVATNDADLLGALRASTRLKHIIHLKPPDPGSNQPCVQIDRIES